MSWYGAMLARRPLLTQSVTTGLLFAAGDITAQQLVDRRGLEHDLPRTGRMLLYGTALFGPVAANWFKFLQRRVVHPNRRVEMLARVAVDQSSFAPVMIGVFLNSMAMLEGGHPREKLQASYVPALEANYYIWPFVQMANFALVPPHHRLLFVNVISVGWNTYLSFLNSRAVETEEKEEEKEEKEVQ